MNAIVNASNTSASRTTGGGIAAQIQEVLGVVDTKKLTLILALAAMMAALVVTFMWMDRATYRVVFPNLTDTDAGAVVNALQGAAIPHQIDSVTGNVQVPMDNYDCLASGVVFFCFCSNDICSRVFWFKVVGLLFGFYFTELCR